MRVAAVQFRGVPGDLDASREQLVGWASEAAEGADLVVLPEMAASGYLFRDRDDVARVLEPARGPTFRALAQVARRHGTWVVGGFPERDGAHAYNSAWVVDPHGELAFVYRKTLLFEADETWAEPGNTGYRTFDTGVGVFGVGICMDLNDLAFLRWVWTTRMDVVAFPTNWIDEGVSVWPYWVARMGTSPAALVAANTWGVEGDLRFSGHSAVVQRRAVLASAPGRGNHIVRTTVLPG